MAWIDLSAAFGYGTKLTSTQMQNLRDNLTAMANGDGGAPPIKEAAMDANSVDQDALKCSEQEQSQSIALTSSYTFSLTGGQYVLLPQFKTDSGAIATATEADMQGSFSNLGTSYEGPQVKVTNTSGSGAETFYCKHLYVTASGEIFWLFIEIDKATDKIIGMSIAPDHPCFGHGIGPEGLPHPFLNYDKSEHQILLANPDFELIEKIRKQSPESLLDGIRNLCDIKDGGYWPDIKVTVDSKKKMKIPRLNYVKMIELKWIG